MPKNMAIKNRKKYDVIDLFCVSLTLNVPAVLAEYFFFGSGHVYAVSLLVWCVYVFYTNNH